MSFCSREQHAVALQQIDDERVRLKDALALVFGQALDESPVVVERRVDLEPVLLPGAIVLDTVPRRRVDDSASLLEVHVIAEDAPAIRGPGTDA